MWSNINGAHLGYFYDLRARLYFSLKQLVPERCLVLALSTIKSKDIQHIL